MVGRDAGTLKRPEARSPRTAMVPSACRGRRDLVKTSAPRARPLGRDAPTAQRDGQGGSGPDRISAVPPSRGPFGGTGTTAVHGGTLTEVYTPYAVGPASHVALKECHHTGDAAVVVGEVAVTTQAVLVDPAEHLDTGIDVVPAHTPRVAGLAVDGPGRSLPLCSSSA